MSDDPYKLIKVAKNEYTLFVYRLVTTVCVMVVTYYVSDIKNSTAALTKDFGDFRLAYAERMGKVEGEVGALRGSVEVHRRRLEGNDTDIRNIWSRIFDSIARGSQGSTNK